MFRHLALYLISLDQKIIKPEDPLAKDCRKEVTEFGTSDKTLADLKDSFVIQELDGRRYLGPELDSIEHMGGYEMDGL